MSASSPLNSQKLRRPLSTLSDLIRNESSGLYVKRDEYLPFMYRAVVYAIDTEGGRIEGPGESDVLRQAVNSGGSLKWYDVKKRYCSRPNPPDSIRARIITDMRDSFFMQEDLRTYWPMFPGLQPPAPGELVYVIFEDASRKHGLWLSKVPLDNAFSTTGRVQLSDIVGTEGVMNDLFGDSPQNGSASQTAETPGESTGDLNSLF